MANIAVNDAGDIMVLGADGRWAAPQMAEDGKGNRVFFDGASWRPLPEAGSTMRSVAQGAMDPVQGGAQLLTHALPSGVVNAVNDATAWVNRQPVIGPVTRALGMTPATPEQIDQQTQAREQDYQIGRARAGQTGTDWARMGGQVAATLPAAALPGGSSLLGAAAAGAGSGAALSALQPVTDPNANFWTEKGQQAAVGGALGAVTGPAGYALGRAISPRVDPNVRTLREAGAEVTPGQALGGAYRWLEDRATSVPFIGRAVSNAQQRSIDTFNVGVANRVLRPLGESLPRDTRPGHAMIDAVDDRISAAYQSAFSRVRPFGPDQQFAQDIAQVAQNFLTPESRQTFGKIVQDRVVSRFQNGRLDGETFKRIDAELGKAIRTYGRSLEPAQQEIATSLRDVQAAMRQLLSRANPAEAPRVRAADKAFAQFIRMERAAASQGAVEGVFSPQQFTSAVRQSDRSARNSRYARGDALMQDLSNAGRAVLPNSVNNSGTADRLMAGALIGGVASGQVPAWALGALGLSPAAHALYSRTGTNALTALAAGNRPAALNALGPIVANSGGAAAVPLGGYLLSPPGQ